MEREPMFDSGSIEWIRVALGLAMLAMMIWYVASNLLRSKASLASLVRPVQTRNHHARRVPVMEEVRNREVS
jgi:hypothetical protein